MIREFLKESKKSKDHPPDLMINPAIAFLSASGLYDENTGKLTSKGKSLRKESEDFQAYGEDEDV